ncbi:Hypothetical protein GLP15_3860 [Giardia lamblia P15]|uniref:Uncharacterized protein n=1 Tax=Giardia intestinalis (strain P15) TaxID=658858 RepID=E1F1B4_GIAIA|nr:Hypothetical protein GLP15_3860 [Giardia lamblia P15]
MPLPRPESKPKRSEKRRKSFCTDTRATALGFEMIEALPAQPSLEPNTHSDVFSSVAPSTSVFLSQETIEPQSILVASETDSSTKLTNRREKRPKTPKLTKEEKRAASLSARAAKSKKHKDDVVAPELLKTSSILPVEDPGRSATTLPGSRPDIKLVPIGYEPTHMLSRPLRTYTRRYQPTSPQPLLAPSGTSPLCTQQHIYQPSPSVHQLPTVSAAPSSLLFSYQSSDPSVTFPSTVSISAAKPNPPPRRKGALFTFTSVSAPGFNHNSHDPEMILHRNLSHCCALPTANHPETLTESRIRHSFSTPITPIGRIPRPVSEEDDTTPMLRTSERDEQSDSQFITLSSPSQAFRPSLPEQEGGSLPLHTEYLNLQNNTDMVVPRISARRPRPMSTATVIPLPQPSVFAGMEPTKPSERVPSTVSNVHDSADRFALTAYSSAAIDCQANSPSNGQTHTPEVHCSQATAMRASPYIQPKSQTLHVTQNPRISWDMLDQGSISTALGLTDINSKRSTLGCSPALRHQQDLLAYEHALDIESAITDVINVESSRFGQLASSRIRDILLERTRSIPEGTSPRDVYRLVRSQLNLIDAGLRDNVFSNSMICDKHSKSRTASPVILHAVARSESKSKRQQHPETTDKEAMLTTVRDLLPPKNVCEAEDLVLDTSEPQPLSCLLDNVVVTIANHVVASPRTVCIDKEPVPSPVYYCTRTHTAEKRALQKASQAPLAPLVDSLREQQSIVHTTGTSGDNADQILETPSPERSLPSASSETIGSTHERSLTASSLRQSTFEPSVECKSFDFSANLLSRHDFTPGGTVTTLGQSGPTSANDLILGEETYSGRLNFVQRVIYDSAACSFDNSSQTVVPYPLIAMDYDDLRCLLVTVATDNVVRIYNAPLLELDQYDELRKALIDGSSSLATYNISRPVASYLPQHARTFPNASPTVIRLGPSLLSVVGYDDGHVSVFDLQSMVEIAYWRTQAQTAVIDLCFYTSDDSRNPLSLSLDSIFSTNVSKQSVQQFDLQGRNPMTLSTPSNVNLFICTQRTLSTYSISQDEESLIDMYTYIHEDEEVWYSALTQNKENPREVYVGCVGGTVFRLFDCAPQRRISLSQVDKVTALSIHDNTLIVGCNMGMTIVFDVQALQSFYRLKSYKDSPVSGVYCDRNKIVITNTSGIFTIWDRRSHLRCVYSSLVHAASVIGLRVAGNRIFTSSADGYTNCFEFHGGHPQNPQDKNIDVLADD